MQIFPKIQVPKEYIISSEIGYTKEKPTDQHLGNGRHFWGHPTEEKGLRELLQS